MKTIEINVPDEILGFIGTVSELPEKFVLEAIKEKIKREKKRDSARLLAEGYRATATEDLKIAREFEVADFENL